MADVRTRSVVLKQPTKSGFGVTGDHNLVKRKERMDEEKEEKTNQSRREGSRTKTSSITVGLQVIFSPCCDQS